MPRRIPRWFSDHPNFFAFVMVVVVFTWSVVRIGAEADKRVASEQRSSDKVAAAEARTNAALAKESKARQEIICLVANLGVDRDRTFVDALIAASSATPRKELTDEEKRRQEEGLRIFLERLEPALRPLECSKFINDPVGYLQELRARVNTNPISATTTTTTAP